MKFTTEIEINLPINKVVELFDNPDNLKEWQPGLVSFEHLSGMPGQPGAKSKLKFVIGKREIEMIETIKVRNLPSEFTGTYEAKGVYNVVKNMFLAIDDNTTKHICENEFEFSGFMKIIGWIMPGAFKKTSYEYQVHFKKFAESKGKA